MIRKLESDRYYRIRDRENFHPAMRSDVELLHFHRRYVSLATIIVCCLDAIAAGSAEASRPKFEAFVTTHLPDLCRALEDARPDKDHPNKKGSAILYDGFRNGFAHRRAPKTDLAIAEDHELGGDWAGRLEIKGVGEFVALNVDRLAREFLVLLDRI